MKYTLLIFLFLVSTSSYSNQLLETFHPFTKINQAKFSEYKITNFYIEPDNRKLTFNQAKSKFDDEIFDVILKTDMPMEVSGFYYRIYMVKNESYCEGYGRPEEGILLRDFMNVTYNNEAFKPPYNYVDIHEFQFLDGKRHQWDKRPLRLSSDRIEGRSLYCQGSVALIAELRL